MTVRLGDNQYGKAETHVVRVTKKGELHDIKDMTVSVMLAGDFADTHLEGDNSKVVPTDSQKNTAYAFARRYGVGEIEQFGLALARHFVDSQPTITRARVHIEEYGWQRLGPHSFQRAGSTPRARRRPPASAGRAPRRSARRLRRPARP